MVKPKVMSFNSIEEMFDFIAQQMEEDHCNGDCEHCEHNSFEEAAREEAAEIAQSVRILYEAFIAEGFTEEQATEFTKSIIG